MKLKPEVVSAVSAQPLKWVFLKEGAMPALVLPEDSLDA